MKFLDLFAGIGGFRLGMESAGHECVGFCEIDKYARASYKAIHNTKGEIELHDITRVTDESIRRFGSVTGIILGRLIADNVYFVNVSTWRKYWKFSYKDRSKKSMKLQAVAKVSETFDLNVKDDEADAILIGSYFVNHGQEFGNLESHKVS